ncbi:hypothetical protein DE146DRAFT_636049 [Phaeosphaeria sp. MPI-PUGE-AT-0046c]|nr:hypothetical protein DE146DRAFT_636049 [Phaeosphaeria sp. MPI-PUGE-AT-0046c]
MTSLFANRMLLLYVLIVIASAIVSATGAIITRQSDGYTDLAFCETENQVHNDPVRQDEPGHIFGQGCLKSSRFDLRSGVPVGRESEKSATDIAMRQASRSDLLRIGKSIL